MATTAISTRPYFQPELETMARPDLERCQVERLRAQVALAAASPFYQRVWRTADVSPEAIRTVADVARLPFVYKQDLVEAQLREPPLGDLPVSLREDRREIYPVNAAEGSAYTVYDDGDLARTAEIGARILWACGLRPGELIHNGFAYGLFAGGISVHRSVRAMGAALIPIGADSVKRQVEFLFNFKPVMMVGTPSHVSYLAERIYERGLSPRDIGLRAGLFGAEPGAAVAANRARLEQLYGCKAYDLYGITEISPLLAAECPYQEGLHWAEDHVLVEVVNPVSHQPAYPGELGVLVLTDLTRKNMPLLRYWTGDMATLVAEPCACGRTHARSIGGIRGRTDDLILFRGAKFYPLQIEQILAGYGNLGEEYKILLERDDGGIWRDRCTIMVEAGPGGAAPGTGLEQRVQRRILDELGVEIQVQIVRYGALERSPIKLRRVEDRR